MSAWIGIKKWALTSQSLIQEQAGKEKAILKAQEDVCGDELMSPFPIWFISLPKTL